MRYEIEGFHFEVGTELSAEEVGMYRECLKETKEIGSAVLIVDHVSKLVAGPKSCRFVLVSAPGIYKHELRSLTHKMNALMENPLTPTKLDFWVEVSSTPPTIAETILSHLKMSLGN